MRPERISFKIYLFKIYLYGNTKIILIYGTEIRRDRMTSKVHYSEFWCFTKYKNLVKKIRSIQSLLLLENSIINWTREFCEIKLAIFARKNAKYS